MEAITHIDDGSRTSALICTSASDQHHPEPLSRAPAHAMPGRELEDPFDQVLKPPPGETLEQKAARTFQEEAAKRVSQAIDESIRAERQRQKKRKPVRVLLLGQSESGAPYH